VVDQVYVIISRFQVCLMHLKIEGLNVSKKKIENN
jgi:hypothetical protein